jgi:hypothetical protein
MPLLALAFELRIKDKMVDFSVNYRAAQRLRLGETLYRTADGHYQFKYMPFSAFLYVPLTLVPLAAAKGTWFALVILSSVLVFFFSAKLLRSDRRRTLTAELVAVLVLGRYFLREIQLGQINALITAVLLLMIVSLDSGRARPSRAGAQCGTGLCWGLATALKPYSLIYLPYFLLKKRWLPVAGGFAVLGLAGLAPAVFYGPGGNFVVLKEWWSTLSASTPSLFSTQDNVSLMGCLVKWTGRPGLSLAIYLLFLGGLAGLVLFLVHLGRNRDRGFVLETFLILALIPLISPLGWDYTLLAAAPAVMLIACHLDKLQTFARLFLFLDFAVIALSLYDLLGRGLYARFMASSAITVCFLILIGYVAHLRIKNYA